MPMGYLLRKSPDPPGRGLRMLEDPHMDCRGDVVSGFRV